MGIESPVPGRVEEWLSQSPADARERIEQELVSSAASPAEAVLRGMQNHAVRLGPPGDLRATLVLDAIGDLLPILGARAHELLLPATSYLLRLKSRPLHPEWCERAPLADSPIIYAGALDEILAVKDLEGSGAGIARLLSVVQSQEYFHELLLEAAARHWEAPGWTLDGAVAVVRALVVRDWREGREFVFRLIESLHGARIQKLATPPPAASKPLPLAAAFLTAARSARHLPAACLYLASAFQAERFCRLRQRQLRHAVGLALEAWFPDLAAIADGWTPAPLASSTAAPVSPPVVITVESLPGEDLEQLLRAGRESEAAAEAVRLSQTGTDADPLFGWMALAAGEALAAGDPMPVLLANSARWGAHLLRGDRDVLVARVARTLASPKP